MIVQRRDEIGKIFLVADHRLLQMAAQVEAEPEVSAYIHFIISLVNF